MKAGLCFTTAEFLKVPQPQHPVPSEVGSGQRSFTIISHSAIHPVIDTTYSLTFISPPLSTACQILPDCEHQAANQPSLGSAAERLKEGGHGHVQLGHNARLTKSKAYS